MKKEKITDPVCGMPIEERSSGLSSSYKGTPYYFCSEKCKRDFDKNPEAVLAMKTEREQAAEEERTESVERVVDEVAHEIRNPLTSIGGFTRRIYESLPADDPNKEYAGMVIEDVARLESMIGQLIDLKTMGLSHAEAANVNTIVHEAVGLFKKELNEKGIEVMFELADRQPALPLDSKKLTAAVGHLIKNAIEAMEKEPGLLKIATRMREGQVEIEVADTGKGIPEEAMKYIFDPLFTSKIYGPGLGLAFVKKIIQEHKGTVSAESELGKGSTFTIRLPLDSH